MTKGLYTPRSGARSFLDALTSEAAPEVESVDVGAGEEG